MLGTPPPLFSNRNLQWFGMGRQASNRRRQVRLDYPHEIDLGTARAPMSSR